VTRGKKLIEGVSQHLEAGETIEHVVDGAFEVDTADVRHGLAVATDRRLLLFAMTAYGGHDLESFPYPTITSFEPSRGLMGGSVSFATTATRATVRLIPSGATFTRFCTWMGRKVAVHPVQA
jgi:hypothetical protein